MSRLAEVSALAKVELEGKLTSGFPAMTTTVQVHKRSPRNGLLKWIVKAITVAALNYEMREALDLFKDWIQGVLQRSLGKRWCKARKIPGLYPGPPQIKLYQEAMRLG